MSIDFIPSCIEFCGVQMAPRSMLQRRRSIIRQCSTNWTSLIFLW